MAYKPWRDLEHIERYVARRYASWDQRWLDRKERSAVGRLISQHGLSGLILDIPGGYGRFLPLLTQAGEVLAADLGFFPLLYQKKRVGLARACVNAEAGRLPFQDRSVDVAFCFRLLQHLHRSTERVAILRELARVSRKWVVVSVYGSVLLHRVFRRVVPQPSRITMVAKDRFEEEVTLAGLTVVEEMAVVPILHAQRIYLLHHVDPVEA